MKLGRYEKILIAFTAVFFTALIFISAISTGHIAGTTVVLPSEKAEQYFININTATIDELDTLSGIGPALAKRIVDYRNTHGPFKTTDDLTKVSGIGNNTLNRIKKYICT